MADTTITKPTDISTGATGDPNTSVNGNPAPNSTVANYNNTYDPNGPVTWNPAGQGQFSQQPVQSSPLGNIAAEPQDIAQQAQSFINPYTNLEQAQINNIPVNQQAAQAVAPQLSSSPLAGLTTFGQPVNISTAQSNPILAAQLQNINAINAQAQGRGPSLAEVQAKQQAQQNIANQMALIGSQRGSSNSALGLRQAQEAAATANQQAVQAGVQGRTAEELAAQQQLTGALSGTQGQVMQGAQAQAGLNQQTMLQQGSMNQQVQLQNQQVQQQTQLQNQQAQLQSTLANLTAKMQTQGLNTQEYNDYIQAQAALANTNTTLAENYANLSSSEGLAASAIANKVAMNNANNQMGLTGAEIAGASAGGAALIGALTPSDRNLKFNISSANRPIKDFLSKIGSSHKSSFNLLEVNL